MVKRADISAGGILPAGDTLIGQGVRRVAVENGIRDKVGVARKDLLFSVGIQSVGMMTGRQLRREDAVLIGVPDRVQRLSGCDDRAFSAADDQLF